MSTELQEFFSLIGKAKKEKEDEFKSLVGDINIDSIFTQVKESVKEEKQKKERKEKQIEKQVKALESWLYAEPIKVKKEKIIEEVVVEPIDAPLVQTIREELIFEIPDQENAQTEPEIKKEDTVDHALKILGQIKTKEEIQENVKDPEIAKIRRELEYLKNLINAQGGGGEVRLEFLDDIDRSTAKTDGYYLKYDATTAKFIGAAVTATSGAISGIGINSNGVSVGTGVTILNFVGTGNTFIIDGTTATISISGNTFNVDRDTQTYVATADQTTFNVNYDSLDNVDVYINGIRLSSNQYTATSGTDIVLSEGAAENDIVDVVGISAGTAAGGSDLTIKDNDTLIGVTSTISFGSNLSVTPVSAGIVTVNVSGLTTSDISGYGIGYATTDYVNNQGFVTSGVVVGYATEGYVNNLVAISTFSGDYNDLTNTPTALSSFTNDVGFITSHTETSTLDNVLTRGNTSSLGMSVGVVTATSFDGNATSATTATTAGSATTSTKVTVGLTPNVLSNWYVGLSSGVLGDHQIHGDIGLTFVPSTNTLTASKFSGELNGNVFTNTGVSTFTGLNATGAINFTTQTPDINISSQIIGALTLGGASQTGTQTFGRSTKTHTANFASGASESAATKTINFGIGGVSGSFTQINIGPEAGIGTIAINSGTNVGFGSTIPTSKLDVVGDVKVSGVVTATSFSGITTTMVVGLSTVASTGSYNDLTNTPTIPTDTGDLTNSVGFVTSSIVVGYATEGYVNNLVAISTFSGDYNDLINQPFIPSIVGLASEGYVNNLVAISTFSGDYNDLTNTPTALSSFTNDVGFATVTYVDVAIANLVDLAPDALNTLNELAAAIGDDANFSTTITNSLASKANLSGANFVGVVTAPTFVGNLTGTASTASFATTSYYLDGQFGSYYLDYNNFTNTPTIPTDTGDLTNSVGFITSGGSGANLTGIVTAITAGANISILENPSGNFIITATVQGGTQNLDSVLTQGNVSGIGLSVGVSTFSGNVYVGSGVTITSNDINIVGVITANTGSFSNFTIADTLTIGSQVFYTQGNNGFSVNEDFDPSNSNFQTAYHYTSGIGRSEVAFTLARTNAFTNGFGIYGTAANNTFVSFGEQSNTNWEWRRGIGIRPLDLDGGTLLMKLSSSGNLGIGTTNPTSKAHIIGSVDAISYILPEGLISSGTQSTSTTSETSIDSFSATTYRSAKYQIQITRGSEYHITEVHIVHDGTSSYGTEYATIKTGSSLSTFSTDISGGNVRLLATPSDSASTVFKLVRTLVEV